MEELEIDNLTTEVTGGLDSLSSAFIQFVG